VRRPWTWPSSMLQLFFQRLLVLQCHPTLKPSCIRDIALVCHERDIVCQTGWLLVVRGWI
jgi:hypothetical protein